MPEDEIAQRTYSCDCSRYCKGRAKQVSRSTFQRHSAYRQADLEATLFPTRSDPLLTRRQETSIRHTTPPRRLDQRTRTTGATQAHPRAVHEDNRPDEIEPVDDHHEPEITTGRPRAIDVNKLVALTLEDDLKVNLEFIRLLQSASIDGVYHTMSAEDKHRLQHPATEPLTIDDPDIRLGLDLFLANINGSQENFAQSRSAIAKRHPEDEIPSYDQMKRIISNLTGISPIVHDMCSNSCIAYTGPFTRLNACPYCGLGRYVRTTRLSQQEFHTIPLGPSLQALWREPASAKSMTYRQTKTRSLLEELDQGDGSISNYDDFFCGSAYLDLVRAGIIEDNDMVLMLSLDGAKLYEHKASDCWMYIWVIFDLPPHLRYKKRHVIPGGFIPGPNKPQHLDSFLFPGLYHLAALQQEGLMIWDSLTNRLFRSNLFLALATADGPAMAYLNGLVGHQGKRGCRLYCPITGRHKDGGTHYYPAMLKPLNFSVSGCSHPDINWTTSLQPTLHDYLENLEFLMAAPNQTQYKTRRLETGIVKPSLFLGLPADRTLGVPNCFGSDIMHLGSLGIPDLLIPLWRGSFDCHPSDDRRNWPWATLKGATWQAHGRLVAEATEHLPGSFDRPPRNPAEKISSGYKAWEFLLYMFGLGPGVFYGILPEPYYGNFCTLVYGMRIIGQHSITAKDLASAHTALMVFVYEFKAIYYQRRDDRLHFVRQSVHALIHLASEVARLGPPIISSQWTMEGTIGNLGQEIKSPSKPYANLSQRGLLRSQINALKAMLPDLDPINLAIPARAIEIGAGYILLRKKDRTARPASAAEAAAIVEYLLSRHGISIEVAALPGIIRWARLGLPNGQVARSLWKESTMTMPRRARNIKFYRENESQGGLGNQRERNIHFAEVQYYFQMNINAHVETLAIVSIFSEPHSDLLEKSKKTLLSCTYQGESQLRVIPVQTIESVIAMVPHTPFPNETRYFVVEKPGLALAVLGGFLEAREDEEEPEEEEENNS